MYKNKRQTENIFCQIIYIPHKKKKKNLAGNSPNAKLNAGD